MRRARGTAAGVLGLAIVLAAPAGEGAERRGGAVTFSGNVAIQLIYDNNIIHYSDADLLELETAVNQGKFSITSAGDWIVRPRLDLAVRSAAVTGRPLLLRFRFTTWRYAENQIKNNDSYSLRLTHPGFGKDNLDLSYTYAPMAYLRNFKDRPPFAPPSAPEVYTEFSLASNSFAAAYTRRLRRDLDGTATLGRAARYYNQPFMENDNWEWNGGGSLAWRAAKPLKLTGEYLYSSVRARAADAVGEDAASSNDGDPSYERDSYGLAAAFRPGGRLRAIDEVTATGQLQIYYFTSQKPLTADPFHVGRRDEVHRLEIAATSAPVGRGVTLDGGYRFTERTSSAAWKGGGEGISEDKDYTDHRFWVGATYPF